MVSDDTKEQERGKRRGKLLFDGAIRRTNRADKAYSSRRHKEAEMKLELSKIGFETREKRHYRKTDIVRLPETDKMQAEVYISADITEAAHIMEICRKHRLKPEESRGKYARLFLKLKAGGIIALSGRYTPKAVQTLVWDYAATVHLSYERAALKLSEPPESEKWNGYGFEPVNPAQWFYEAARG